MLEIVKECSVKLTASEDKLSVRSSYELAPHDYAIPVDDLPIDLPESSLPPWAGNAGLHPTHNLAGLAAASSKRVTRSKTRDNAEKMKRALEPQKYDPNLVKKEPGCSGSDDDVSSMPDACNAEDDHYRKLTARIEELHSDLVTTKKDLKKTQEDLKVVTDEPYSKLTASIEELRSDLVTAKKDLKDLKVVTDESLQSKAELEKENAELRLALRKVKEELEKGRMDNIAVLENSSKESLKRTQEGIKVASQLKRPKIEKSSKTQRTSLSDSRRTSVMWGGNPADRCFPHPSTFCKTIPEIRILRTPGDEQSKESQGDD